MKRDVGHRWMLVIVCALGLLAMQPVVGALVTIDSFESSTAQGPNAVPHLAGDQTLEANQTGLPGLETIDSRRDIVTVEGGPAGGQITTDIDAGDNDRFSIDWTLSTNTSGTVALDYGSLTGAADNGTPFTIGDWTDAWQIEFSFLQLIPGSTDDVVMSVWMESNGGVMTGAVTRTYTTISGPFVEIVDLSEFGGSLNKADVEGMRVRFSSAAVGGGSPGLELNLIETNVPEPATMTLLGLASLAGFVSRRRRKK